MRRYLVVVRAGSKSLHRRLLNEDPGRNWDCCVNFHGTPAEERLAESYLPGGINKFEGLERVLAGWPGEFPYRYVLSLDDDVYFAPGDISRFFTVCDLRGSFIAQPALRWTSFFSHRVTLRNPATLLRAVRFIEVMAPCFSAQALQLLRPTFMLAKSLWGTDVAWSALCAAKHPMHIIDEVSVVHTKPILRGSGPFYRMLRDMGVNPDEDLARVQALFPHFRLRVGNERAGHVFRAGIPRPIGPLLMNFFEAAKLLAKHVQSVRRRRWKPAGPD